MSSFAQTMDSKTQSISIQLIADGEQNEKKLFSSYSYRLQNWCDEKYLISVALGMLIIILMIVLIVVYRETSGRCAVFSNPNQCRQPNWYLFIYFFKRILRNKSHPLRYVWKRHLITMRIVSVFLRTKTNCPMDTRLIVFVVLAWWELNKWRLIFLFYRGERMSVRNSEIETNGWTTFDVPNQFEDLKKQLATGSYYIQNVLDLADINTRLQSSKTTKEFQSCLLNWHVFLSKIFLEFENQENYSIYFHFSIV